jgi:hypothetical protein
MVAASVGCTDSLPTQASEETPQLAKTTAGPRSVASVNGAAHFQLKDPPPFVGDFKWIYRFSVRASISTDGVNSGVVRFSSHQPPGQNDEGFPGAWHAEVAVDCLEIEGNTAWISGPIVNARTDSPFGPQVGVGTALVIVRDHGPTGPDEVNVGPASQFGVNDCRDRPAIFPALFADGNLTVSGGD